MSLRLRLVVVFFLLSVVPLAAVTWYTYDSNLTAVHEAAQREADSLAAELSQRMELVTAQLRLRVGELVPWVPLALPEQGVAGQPAGQTTAADAQSAAAAEDAAAGMGVDANQVRDVLGEMAVLLDNVEVFDRRGRGRGRGRVGGPPPAPPDSGAEPGDPPSTARLDGPGPDGAEGGDAGRRGRGNGPGDEADGPEGDEESPDSGAVDPSRIVVDMTPIRREIIRQYVPDGRWDEMSSEERAKVFAEVQQRILGIRQGIDILRQEVAERAVAAATALPDVTSTPLEGGVGPVDPTVAASVPTAAADAMPLQRRSELSSGRIDVRLERDGQIVSQANAAINLRNLLDMVFTNTPREGGDVPFAVGSDGHVFAPGEAARETVRVAAGAAVGTSHEPLTLLSPDWVVVTHPDPTGSVATIGIARPLGPAVDRLRQRAVRNALVGLGLIGLALVAIVPLAGGLTRNLDRLGAGVNQIADGDYTARVDVRGSDEVGRLAAAFNRMAAEVELHQHTVVQQERMRRELELGRQIQSDMLPQTPLRAGATEVTGLSTAAREVGGDFFNYFALADGTLALLMGDVSGKGVGAAMLMANIQGALRTRLTLGQDLAVLAHEIDEEVDKNTPRHVYATLFAGILDPERRRLRWVNAGHNPQYIVRAGGGLERMESTGRPIGLLAGGGYEQHEFDLFAGDLLFFYTDGCVEAWDQDGEMFGVERLEAVLAATAGTGADEAIAAVRDAIDRFRGTRELQDDATMMVARVG